ncbi:MFS transporter [Paracoccus caeni]|uniref:MFS transporter n=1 Tax=Paracoccus caeni TaxID=657651 RepID=A0A934VUV8_9RHOB|nr:MFS transporter [Paracoccus caeni]MBK4216241.1 MFS transporter [Paracoccus caeni]
MSARSLHTWFAIGHLANDWPIAALWLIVPAAGMSMALAPAEVGLLFTVLNIGGALAYLPAGMIADHAPNRGRWLLATFWWIVIGYAAAAFATDFWSLALLLAIAGMGNAAWHPIAAGILAQDSKQGRGWALGIHAIGGSAAEILAPLLVGLMLLWVGWREALIVSVLPTLIVGICLLRVVRRVPIISARPLRRKDLTVLLATWRGVNGQRIGMICLYNMALMALLSMIPLYLVEAHGLGSGTVGVIFSAMLVLGAVVQPWAGRVSDRSGRRPVLVVGTALAGLACLVLVATLPLWAVIVTMIIAVAALDAIRSTMLATAVDHTGRSEGTTLGLAFALMDGIGALGAVLAGFAAGVSWPHMFGLAAFCAFGATMLATTLAISRPSNGE